MSCSGALSLKPSMIHKAKAKTKPNTHICGPFVDRLWAVCAPFVHRLGEFEGRLEAFGCHLGVRLKSLS